EDPALEEEADEPTDGPGQPRSSEPEPQAAEPGKCAQPASFHARKLRSVRRARARHVVGISGVIGRAAGGVEAVGRGTAGAAEAGLRPPPRYGFRTADSQCWRMVAACGAGFSVGINRIMRRSSWAKSQAPRSSGSRNAIRGGPRDSVGSARMSATKTLFGS